MYHLCAGLMIAALATAAAARDAAPDRVIPVGGIVPVVIEGRRGDVRVDPGAPGVPLLDDGFARRIDMKAGRFGIGLSYAIGADRVSYLTKVKRFDASASPSGRTKTGRRVGSPWRPTSLPADAIWTPPSYAGVADGTISPLALPDAVVRLSLHPPRPGERTMALPMVDGGGMFGRFAGLYALVDVGGVALRVRFDPYRPRTWANVGAGMRIAAAHAGRVAGPPTPITIAFGLTRPVRTMTLANPLAIGPLEIRSLGVRTTDPANRLAAPETGIPDADIPFRAPDPDEIVVTAKGRRDTKQDRLTIGADMLAACSSITIDKPARQIRLTCI